MELFKKFGKKPLSLDDRKPLPEGFEAVPPVAKGSTKKEKIPVYHNGRHEWNSIVGMLFAKNRIWQIVALFCLIITIAAVGGIIHIGSQSKFIPYVVEVDKLGQAAVVRIADRTSPIDGRVVHAQLASFIADARTVTPDVDLQKRAIFNVYAMLSPDDAATNKMNEWLNGKENDNPFVRAEKVTVSVEISSVLEQSPETWQVEWLENVRTRDGQPVESFRMRALIQIFVAAPTVETTMDEIQRNPLGLFVKDFNWSKQI